MKPSVEILNELLEISPLLAGLERKNVFSVPEGYFNTLPAMISDKLGFNSFVPFKEIPDSGLTVPEGYFENLSSNILNKIRALQNESALDEIKNISPVLYSLQNKNVFQVREGYFNQLPGSIQQALKPQAKVISIKQRNSVWRIAVAAMITGVIAVSSLWISQKPTENKAVIAVNETKNIPVVIAASEYKNDEQIDDGISKLSDDDIIKYLQTTANATDNESLTASIEENELPAQQDYLSDDKTLQNYLNDIETTTAN